MGRNKEPINLIQAKGNRAHLSKKAIEKRASSEPTPKSDEIKPPSWLDKKEKKRFNEYASELSEARIMSNLDIEALARYVHYELQLRALNVSLRGEIPSSLERAYQKQLNQFMNELGQGLGLTALWRCRIAVPVESKQEKAEKDDPFDLLFGDG